MRRAAAVVREDRPGDKRIVGYLLAEENAVPDIAKIRTNVASSLPEYMVPSVITVVDEFPHTPSGKLDRKSFPSPSTERPDIGTEFVKPKTKQQKQLARIWADVLQLDKVGTQDNFFELGGNSIRAVKAVSYTHLTLPTILLV